MNQIEFMALHAECITVLERYLVEARKTLILLGRCTTEPLSFRNRFALLAQGIIEKNAHLMYLEAQRLLYGAALLGYGALPKDSSPAATLALLQN
jgi:hypothetical protein